MQLSEQQTSAFDAIMKWHKESPNKTFVLAGYAGTGKTTLAKYIAYEFNNVQFCAYTGKAANVLREKGCKNASTIHGAIYTLIGDEDEEPVFMLDPDSDLKYCDLVIVDEYSMLSNEIISDLLSLARKVLFLGDPFQLPPVDGECGLEPDRFLKEVHRQALDSPIIRNATKVRNNEPLSYCNEGEFIFLPRNKVPKGYYHEVEQVIVGYNKTRNQWNQRFRSLKGYGGKYPVKGEKVICLKNNHEKGLFNGMIGTMAGSAIKDGPDRLNFPFEDFQDLKVWNGTFLDEKKPPIWAQEFDRFDFGYVITCHKSQGSEFDDIIVYNQPIGSGEMRRRWLYTAITRAKKKCILVDPE